MVGSSLPRRALGRRLRSYREQANKSQLAAGLHIDLSPQSIGRIEDGQKVKLSTGQIRDLLDLYGVPVDGAEREEVLGLWQEVKDQAQAAKLAGTTKGWWQAYTDQYAPHFDHYLGLEAVATHLTTHQVVLLPGLLQTAGYRRAVSEIAYPDHSASDMDRRLELASHRQVRLSDSNFRVDVLLSEGVLRHTPGGPSVMADQLNHLLQMTDTRPNVSIRVVPLNSGSHLGLLVQSFTLLEFPPLANHLVEPPIVYVEGYEGGLYLERPDMIERHRRAISDIQRVALSEDDTKQLVHQLAKEYVA
ncbi:helix-turn-helix domain-containing protein [Nocardia sp. CDC160]|uniref:helix-turn-helix domain-containing protein n=1 Tax=Nocardia sp. CDC160 TaxID=3112166 RepID=UPI002DB766E9|nr:helix-turn-helix transcriptional regulator [Nocardia sp. CDC160]MEC3915622.1 helix-turn-helix transcriptional regulator [Nocardia sp. CDC160]